MHRRGFVVITCYPNVSKVVKWIWGFEVKHGNMENPFFTQMQFSNQKGYQGTSK